LISTGIYMISYSNLLRLYKKARDMKAHIVFSFEGTRYKLVINRYIHARDEYDRRVPWTVAFGSKLPHDVLSTFKVKSIVVKLGDRTLNFNDLREFLKWIGA